MCIVASCMICLAVVRGTKKTAPSRVKECSHEVLAGPGMGHMGVADESVIRDPPTKKRKTIKTVVDFMERKHAFAGREGGRT